MARCPSKVRPSQLQLRSVWHAERVAHAHRGAAVRPPVLDPPDGAWPRCATPADVAGVSPALALLFSDAANNTEPLQAGLQPAYVRRQVGLVWMLAAGVWHNAVLCGLHVTGQLGPLTTDVWPLPPAVLATAPRWPDQGFADELPDICI